MRLRLALVALLAHLTFASGSAAAQAAKSAKPSVAVADSIPEFYKLRSPASPAFVILGISPSVVEQPTTPTAVAVNLLQNFVKGVQPVIPQNFALDVAPYWLVSHPRLTWDRYSHPSIGLGALQTLTFSVATTDSAFKVKGAAPGDSSISKLALGFRVTPFRGTSVGLACADSIVTRTEPLTDSIGVRVSRLLMTTPGATERQVDSVTAVAVKEYAKANAVADSVLTKRCRELIPVHEGFVLSFAGAGAMRFPGGATDGGSVSAWSLWATPMWASRSVTTVGVARYGQQDGASRFSAKHLDLGARAVLAWSNYAASAEGVWRHRSESGVSRDLYRSTVGFNVKLAGKLWLNTAFGKDFAAKDASSLLALVNLQWNVGENDSQSPAELYTQMQRDAKAKKAP